MADLEIDEATTSISLSTNMPPMRMAHHGCVLIQAENVRVNLFTKKYNNLIYLTTPTR
jgi:hypothetical protein